jgi:tetratricopeptide (TPR) repeat protein
MGKVFRNHTSQLKLVFLLFFIILLVPDVQASYREYELFDRGYEYYLSYQPDKAAAEFRQFLTEFPSSSAKDAVMFWLGKSLMQVKSYEEAGKVFSDIKQQFPDSLFLDYVEKELDAIASRQQEDIRAGTPSGEVSGEGDTHEEKLPEFLRELHLGEDYLTGALEEKEGKSLPDEDKMEAGVDGLEKGEASFSDSLVVLTTLEISDVLWRSGNVFEDIENERVLYEKAKSMNITPDMTQLTELVEKHNFTQEQADYLYRYLTICEFIDRKLKEIPEETIVESLLVKYGEDDKFAKILLSTELHTQAKTGADFRDIEKSYHNAVQFKILKFQDMEEWIKAKISSLKNDEIGVIWSEDGYTILKPVSKKLSCNPSGEMTPGEKERIKAAVEEWLEELRRE